MEYVHSLINAIGTDIKVMLDTEHNGCMWNAIRAWEDYRSDPSATHWCVMADDTDVVDNYLTLEKMCIERFPDAIWTFYSNELNINHRPERTPYIRLSSLNIRGIAFAMPVHLIDGYVALCKKMLSEYKYQRDDATCRIYALFNNIPVMTSIPNLVRSHEIKSAMSGHGITHNSSTWQGKSVNPAPFLTMDYGEVYTAKKSAMETHLHEDNPVHMEVKRQWQRMNVLRKGKL